MVNLSVVTALHRRVLGKPSVRNEVLLLPSLANNIQALYAMQPWGAERDNFHVAMLLQQGAAIHRKPGTQPPNIMRWMLTRKKSSNVVKIAALKASITNAIKMQKQS